jgi:hypothetical protein
MRAAVRHHLMTRLVRALALAGLMGVGFAVLALVSVSGAADRDFVQYWAAAKLISQHHNPYDPSAVASLEKAAGRTIGPIVVRNPPPMLLLTLPFAWMSLRPAAILWMLLLLSCLITSIHLLRQSNDRTHLLGYLFAPVLMCLMAEQSSMFLLLGISLFFRFHNTSTFSFLAGIGLTILCFKPHLLVVFGVPLFCWIVSRKQYRTLLGFVVSTGIASLWRVSLWRDYFEYLKSSPIYDEYIPTLAGTLRLVTGHPFMQVAPLCCGLLWVVWYWGRHRSMWSWFDHGLMALLVSVLVAPYAWTTDEVVLLPAIFGALYRCSNRAVNVFAVVNGVALLEAFCSVQMPSGAYFWTPLAWLLWFSFSRKSPKGLSGGVFGSNGNAPFMGIVEERQRNVP